MPSQAAHLTDIRTPGHVWRASLSIFTGGSPVMTATATAPSSFPAVNIAISVSSGSASNVQRGMRVDVYNSAGTGFKGRLRVRFAGTISSANLPVREFSRGHVDIATGDVLKVYADYRLSDKLVAANETFAPDMLTYTDEGSNPPPIVNTGGLYVGKASWPAFTIHNSRSYVVDPDSGGSKTYLTTLPSGLTFASGTSTSSDPTVEGDAGEYVIDAQVTDAGNSKSAVQHVPVMLHDASNPPYRVRVTNLGGDPENGWEWSVEILSGNISLDAFPAGALCALWVDETIGGVRQSFGALVDDRSHIKAVGYISDEEEGGDGQSGVKRLSFTIASPMRVLNETLGYSKVMTNTASPDAWSEMKALTTKRAKLQILQFYTNWNQTWDVEFGANYLTKTYPELFLTKQSPLAAIRDLADGVDAEVTCDRRGVLHIHTNPHYVALASRAATPKQFEFAARDVLDFTRRRTHRRPLEMLECSGFTAGYSGNAAIFSRWPGLAPGEGVQFARQERLIADSQTELNERTGRRGALLDGIHQTAAGVLYLNEEWTLVLRGSYDAADFYGEYFTLPVLSRRGDTTTGMLYVLLASSFDADADRGTGRTTLRLATAAAGVSGQTYVPPQESDNGIPPFNPPDFYVPPFSVTQPTVTEAVQLVKGTQRIALIGTLGVALTENFGSAENTAWALTLYAAISSGVVGGTPVQWVPDGHSNPASGWIVTSTLVTYLSIAALTASAKHTFATASAKRSADASRGRDGYFGVATYYDGVGTKVLRTTDNATFSEATVSTAYVTDGSGVSILPGIYLGEHAGTTDRMVISAHTGSGTIIPGTATSELKRSTNSGSSFSQLSALNVGAGLAQHIHSPWSGDESTFFYGMVLDAIGASNSHRLYRDSTDISPVVGGNTYGPRGSRDGMMTFVGNPNRLLACLQSGPIAAYSAFLTDNALAASPSYTLLEAGTDYRRVAISGDNGATFYFWGPGGVGLSADSGQTIVSQLGNLNLAALGEPIGLAGY